MIQTGVRKEVAALRARMPVDIRPAPETLDLAGISLARRQVTRCNECPGLVVELIAQATSQGKHVGVVGWPELLLAQVAEEGRLDKVIVVPEPGAEALAVTGVLVEGLDLVVHHSAPVQLTPTAARPLLARVRAGRAALVTVGLEVPGTLTLIEGHAATYRGIGAGTGRITGVDINVRIEAKGRRPQQKTVTLGRRRRLEAV